MHPTQIFHALLVATLLLTVTQTNSAHAAPKKKEAAPAADVAAAEGEEVDVSKVSEKYWAQGKESELGVVQNRKYSYDGKLEVGIFGGSLSSDPFLSVNTYGGRIGYHFNQTWSINAIGWKANVSNSDAFNQYNVIAGAPVINTNKPKSFYGLEIDTNLLYGKLSLLGSAIIYVDIFVFGGGGLTDTESGSYFTPFVGIGQKIFLSQLLSLQLDYRIMQYNETIKSKAAATLGQTVGTRNNTTNVISLGLSFII